MPVCLLGLAVIISRQKLLIMEPERQDQSRQRVQGSVATHSPVYLHYLSLGLIRGVNRQWHCRNACENCENAEVR